MTLEHVIWPRDGYPFLVELAVTYVVDGEAGLTVQAEAVNGGAEGYWWAVNYGAGNALWRQILTGIILSVPSRAERVFINGKTIDLRFAIQNPHQFSIRIKNAETDRSFHRRRHKPKRNISRRGCGR